MNTYEDDTPFVIPEHLKGLTTAELHARVELLFAKHEKERAERKKTQSA